MTLPDPYPNDFINGDYTPDPDWKPWKTWETVNGVRQWEDEWHNVWRCLPTTTVGEVVEGVMKDWSDLETYQLPRLDLPARYDKSREMFASTDKYRMGYLSGFPFAFMRYARRIEEFLADVLLYPDEVNAFQRKIVDMLKRCIDQWATTGADGIFFCEDWGTQERLLVSPKLWHEMFEWGYREILDHAKSHNIDMWMHCCGYIKDIIPSLVDMGIKVLQLDQPKLSGLDYLAEQCHGKTAIWSPVDIQRDLPTADEAYIRSCARELIDVLGSNGGGFVCGHYGTPLSLGVQPEWQNWADDEFTKYAEEKGR